MPSNEKINSLKNFQKQFINIYIGKQIDAEFLASIKPGGKLLNSNAALKIYQKGYICRLTEALGEIYEGVWSVLGDKEFFRCAEDYILSHPSQSYNLSYYGWHFAEFLKSSKFIKDFPFISELARLDLAFFKTFHLPQHRHLEPRELAKIEHNPDCVMKFGTAVTLLELSAPVYQLWKNSPDFGPPSQEREYLVLYKQNDQVFVKQLEIDSFNMLSALQSGTSLNSYLEHNELAYESISSLFHFIASAGLVISIVC